MSPVSSDQKIDSYLSAQTPLEQRKTFSDSKWFLILLFFLGIHFILVLYALNNYIDPDWKDSENVQNIYTDKLKILRSIMDSMNKITLDLKFNVLFSTSVISSVFLMLIVRHCTRIFINISTVIFMVFYVISILYYFTNVVERITEIDISQNPALKSNESDLKLFFIILFQACTGYSIYLAVTRVTIKATSQIIKESYKVVVKFPLAILIFSQIFLLSYLAVKLGLFVNIQLVDIWKDSRKKLFVFHLLLILNVFVTFWYAFFFFCFGVMVLSKIYATWYWTVDKNSISSIKTTFKALWTTFKYDLGLIAFGSAPWVFVPVIVIIWKNARNKMSNFKELPVSFKIIFCLNTLRLIPFYGLFIGASHKSKFLQSTKIASYFCFRNALSFFATDSVFVIMEILKTFIYGVIVKIAYSMLYENLDTYSSYDKELSLFPKLSIYENFIVYLSMVPFIVSFFVSVGTMLLYTSENTERNNQSKNQNVPYGFNIEIVGQATEQSFNTRL